MASAIPKKSTPELPEEAKQMGSLIKIDFQNKKRIIDEALEGATGDVPFGGAGLSAVTDAIADMGEEMVKHGLAGLDPNGVDIAPLVEALANEGATNDAAANAMAALDQFGAASEAIQTAGARDFIPPDTAEPKNNDASPSEPAKTARPEAATQAEPSTPSTNTPGQKPGETPTEAPDDNQAAKIAPSPEPVAPAQVSPTPPVTPLEEPNEKPLDANTIDDKPTKETPTETSRDELAKEVPKEQPKPEATKPESAQPTEAATPPAPAAQGTPEAAPEETKPTTEPDSLPEEEPVPDNNANKTKPNDDASVPLVATDDAGQPLPQPQTEPGESEGQGPNDSPAGERPPGTGKEAKKQAQILELQNSLKQKESKIQKDAQNITRPLEQNRAKFQRALLGLEAKKISLYAKSLALALWHALWFAVYFIAATLGFVLMITIILAGAGFSLIMWAFEGAVIQIPKLTKDMAVVAKDIHDTNEEIKGKKKGVALINNKIQDAQRKIHREQIAPLREETNQQINNLQTQT